MQETVIPHNLALGDFSGELDISKFINGQDLSRCQISGNRQMSGHGTNIEIDSANNFSKRISLPPTVIKIDVEGMELDVLYGMEDLISKNIVRDIFIEIHPSA